MPLLTAGGLEWVAFEGPFRHKVSYDSVKPFPLVFAFFFFPFFNMNRMRPGSCFWLCCKPPSACDFQRLLTRRLKQGLVFQEKIKCQESQRLQDMRRGTGSASAVRFSDGSVGSGRHTRTEVVSTAPCWFLPLGSWHSVFWTVFNLSECSEWALL